MTPARSPIPAAAFVPARPTPQTILEILEHEAIVPEAYRDSQGIWTWGVGVTDASGHLVARYRNQPQTMARCLEVYEWLLRKIYLPQVLAAFAGMPLTEHEIAGALSFHYNTGAIGRATWAKQLRAGDRAAAYDSFLNWCEPREIIARRKAERELLFNGTWTHDGKVLVYGVAKPSYTPRGAQLVDIRAAVAATIAKAGG